MRRAGYMLRAARMMTRTRARYLDTQQSIEMPSRIKDAQASSFHARWFDSARLGLGGAAEC